MGGDHPWDLVRNDLARPPWWKIVQMYRTTGIALLNGAFGRILRINGRFALQQAAAATVGKFEPDPVTVRVELPGALYLV